MKTLITKWYLFCPYLASLFALALFLEIGIYECSHYLYRDFYLITLFRRIWFPWRFSAYRYAS